MVEKLGIDWSKIGQLGNLLYKNYGTTMAGLRQLTMALTMMNITDKVHAAKALKRLGLEDCFEGIICFETLNPTHKNTISDDEDGIEFVRLDN
uniref:Uncharacterized protein n=1 Tax=Cannabis sativa TaxID=3483 RepID=A0A803QJC9_CANSA